MHSPACPTSAAPPGQPSAEPKGSRLADRVYQGWTLAAMFVLLATLWLFW